MFSCMAKDMERTELLLELIAAELYLARFDRQVERIGIKTDFSPSDYHDHSLLIQNRPRLIEDVEAKRAALKGFGSSDMSTWEKL